MMQSEVPRTHPAVLVTAGLFCIAALQGLIGYAFWLLLLALLGSALALGRAALGRMLWRSKWIFVSIVVLFAWQTPGRAVMVDFWQLSPSVEGLMLAAEHVARLAGMIAVIVLLMSRLQVGDWVAALHVLAAPCRWLGLGTDRFSARLTLVLEAVSADKADKADKPTWRDLLGPVSAMDDEASSRTGVMSWDLAPPSSRDLGMLWLAWSGAVGVMAWFALS
ncbi:MAG: hypothetical protein QM776_17305 [Rhodocyclaceae bacterium]